MMLLSPLEKKDLPEPIKFRKLIGPSFIILGLGLGSGEIILWPYLASRYGMGIIWGALLGITFQFFMNMEIERYALINGESIFVGFARKLKILPYWFLLSTFLPWIWPGIAAASAKLFGSLLGIADTKYLAIAFLILMGTILSFGKTLYKTVEKFQTVLIAIGVPTIFALTIILSNSTAWGDLLKGVVGQGKGFKFLPAGIPIASFLAALAYAGAGGNLNLAQSFYVKEKGYGMGRFAGKISNLLTGKNEKINLEGVTFEETPDNIKRFKVWWKNINIEHFLIFWLTGSITILLLALLAYVTTYGKGQNSSDIGFVIVEASEIGRRILPIAGTFFLIVTGATLFGTQMTVLDATSRILTENSVLASKKPETNVSRVYYSFLWLQIVAGVVILALGFSEPLQLLIIAAVLNAFAMFVHVGLTLWLNKSMLQKSLRPKVFRTIAMVLAFLFYFGFSVFTILNKIF